MKKDDITPYIRFLQSVQMPDLNGVLLDGRDSAENGLLLEDNPYPKHSKEYLYWNEGWWAGFYEEENASLFSTNTATAKNTSKIADNKSLNNSINEALNKSRKAISDWVESVSFIMGTFMVGYLSYELVDIVI